MNGGDGMESRHVIESFEHPFGVTLECVVGDIAGQGDVDAIVNEAHARLGHAAGVAAAIQRAAGPALERELGARAPITPGQAVITGAHHLPNRHVIHVRGPAYDGKPGDVLLASCYRNALKVAVQHRVTSLALPPIATGVFGYPMDIAARIACRSIVAALRHDTTLRLVRVVCVFAGDARVHCRAFDEALASAGELLTQPHDLARGRGSSGARTMAGRKEDS